MIPCIKNKCITYPACMSKQWLDCPILDAYVLNLAEENNELTAWNLIQMYLPNVKIISKITDGSVWKVHKGKVKSNEASTMY